MDRHVVLSTVLVVHLTVALVHGSTHALVPVVLAPWQNALVLGTVFIGPVVGVVLVRRDHPLGLPLFTTTMAGALLLGGVLHFVIENPDHVHVIPHSQWRVPFQVSAVGVAVTSTVGTAVGVRYWRTR
jgi:ABC-type xylose transport system permease subunit